MIDVDDIMDKQDEYQSDIPIAESKYVVSLEVSNFCFKRLFFSLQIKKG